MTMNIMEPVLGTAIATAVGDVVPVQAKRKYTNFLAYNGTAGIVTIEIYLVPTGLAADTTHRYLRYPLAIDESYTCPELVGAALKAGGRAYVLGLGVSFSSVASDTYNS